MKFPYTVKANGKWYAPNEDVPDRANEKNTSSATGEIQTVILHSEDDTKKRGRNQHRS